MLRRIILIVAIVAGLAAGVVNFTVVRQKIGLLQTDRDQQRSAKEEAQRNLAKTKRDLADTQNQLSQTKQDLASAQAARDALSTKLTAANTQIQDLSDKLAKTSKQRDDAEDQLAAYKNTGKSPEEILSLDKELKDSEAALAVANDEKVILTHDVARLQNQIYGLLGSNIVVTLPASLKGTVMAVDPKWDFVVLNIGESQGVLDNAEMLVSRDGRLVGKVIVRSVQKDRSIANLVPGWQLGQVFEGDEVIPAHPAS